MTWVGPAAISVALIAGLFVATQIHKWFDSFTFVEGLVGLIQELHLKAISKILVAAAQITCSFAPVLNIQMPPIFKSFLSVLGIFNFDISLTIGVGCFSDGSYVTSLATSFALVVAVIILVGIDYLYEMWKVRRETEGAVANSPSVHGGVISRTETLRKVFDRFDKDANGTIELEEMMQVVQEIDESATPEQVTALFRRADTDGDGALDFDEFLAAITQPTASDGLDLGALLSRQRNAQGYMSMFLQN
jgi:hypothetical protein